MDEKLEVNSVSVTLLSLRADVPLRPLTIVSVGLSTLGPSLVTSVTSSPR